MDEPQGKEMVDIFTATFSFLFNPSLIKKFSQYFIDNEVN